MDDGKPTMDDGPWTMDDGRKLLGDELRATKEYYKKTTTPSPRAVVY
jgi:hypothetical protein